MRLFFGILICLQLLVTSAYADDTSRFIGERLTAQYNANVAKAKGDSGKKAELSRIFKAAMAKIGKTNGMAAAPIAKQASADMKKVF